MSVPQSSRRVGLSIRARLTLTYAALIVVTGLAMIAAVRITVWLMNGANIELLYQITTLTLVAIAAVGAGASWIIAGWMLRPLQRLNHIARQVDETTLDTRLNLAGPKDEIRSLADTFDVMFSRLESAFSSRALFAANASHELRTPLATMKTMLQVALLDEHDASTRETLTRLLTTVESLIETTTALLDLAQAGHADLGDTFDLSEIIDDAMLSLSGEIEQRKITTSMLLPPTLITGNRRLIENLVHNLVRNAAVHNIDNGWLGVTVDVASDRRLVLTVENSGDVVPGDKIRFLTEPFYRVRLRTAGGHGLGLALVQSIADAHDAVLMVSAKEPNGLVVRISFPPSAAATDSPVM